MDDWKKLGEDIVKEYNAAVKSNNAAEIARLEKVKKIYADTTANSMSVEVFRQKNNY